MKTKAKRTFYVVEAGENLIKVARGVETDSGKEFIDFKAISFSSISDGKVEDKIIGLLQELHYRREPVIFSLPRNLATLRYLKIPARDPEEIERIITFQAPRHIPYPPEELITGYEKIRTDSEGFTHVNLVIVHQDMVASYLKVCQLLKLSRPVIRLSSFGLGRSFSALKPEETTPVVVLDIDDNHVEFAVVSQGALTFSRSLKFDVSQSDWQNRLVDELTRTLEVYAKEVSQEPLAKVFLVGKKDLSILLAKFFAIHTRFLVQELLMNGHIHVAPQAKSDFERSVSFYSLVGLGLLEPRESLSLLPAGMKGRLRRRTLNTERLKLSLTVAATLLFFILGLALNVHNKAVYLERVKGELRRIQSTVGPLEEIDRRVALLKKSTGKSAGLDILYGLHQLMPEDISLNSLDYDVAGKVILRGQTRQLEGVFAFAQKAETAEAFKGYAVVVNYATKKKTAHGEMIDFEIVANKR